VSSRAPTHAEVCAYYAKLGLLAEVSENATQAAFDAANALALEHPDVPMPKKASVAKGSSEAKAKMAKVRAARGKK
jgi:hypothetical protein